MSGLPEEQRHYEPLGNLLASVVRKTIDVSGAAAQWDDVNAVYRRVGTDDGARNNIGGATTIRFSNDPVRNNILEVRVTNDADNVYFFIKTDKDIVKADTSDWMNIFIGKGRPEMGKGWEGYEFVLNRTFEGSQSIVEKLNADGKVETWVRDAAKHGAEYLLFFRWRQSVNGEQYHPAILPWSGKKGTGYEFVKKIAASGIRTEMPKSGVAILHSNESDQDTLVRGRNIQFGQYEDASILLNATLEKRGILPDYLMSGRDVDFSPYRFVFVPVNTIVPPEVAAKLKDYVKAGGKVLAICRLNLLDPKGGSYYTEPYPVGMTDLFGIEIHEQRARPDWKYAYDLVEPKRCWTLLNLKEGAFAGKPALTSAEYGRGRAFYYAKLPQTEEEMEMLLDRTLGLTEAKRAEFLKIAEQAMVTPVLDTAPAAKYLVKNLETLDVADDRYYAEAEAILNQFAGKGWRVVSATSTAKGDWSWAGSSNPAVLVLERDLPRAG